MKARIVVFRVWMEMAPFAAAQRDEFRAVKGSVGYVQVMFAPDQEVVAPVPKTPDCLGRRYPAVTEHRMLMGRPFVVAAGRIQVDMILIHVFCLFLSETDGEGSGAAFTIPVAMLVKGTASICRGPVPVLCMKRNDQFWPGQFSFA